MAPSATTGGMRQPSGMQLAMRRAHDPEVLQLGLGLPAPELLPGEDLATAAAEALRDPSGLQYGAPEGHLKEQIVALMAVRGVACTEDEVFLTAGAQQALSLLVRLFAPGHARALVTELVYPAFRQAAEHEIDALTPVQFDSRWGIDIDELQRELRRGPKPALLYAMSAGHNPSGVTMTETTRRAVVEIAVRHRLPVIEDDVYGFLQYDTRLEPPMRALDSNWIFYVGSFSKLLGPALRIGWIVAPAPWVKRLSVLKEADDLDVKTVPQRIVGRYLERHSIVDRIADVRAAYRARRDVLCAALSARLSSVARWEVPRAGFFVWTEATDAADTEILLNRAVSGGVAFAPGAFFSMAKDDRHRRWMRLSFSCCPQDRMNLAVSLLADVFPHRLEHHIVRH